MKFVYSLYASILLLITMCEAIYDEAELNDVFYNNWLEKYRAISGNEQPPKRFRTWIQEVNRMGVSVEPSIYKPIYEHLKYLKEMGMSVDKVRNQHQKVLEMYPHLRGSVMGLTTRDLMHSQHWRSWPRSSNFDLLSSVMDPNIECFAIIHKEDEGMVLPADDSDAPYTDMKDVFRRSETMRNLWGDYADKCIHLQAPTRFHSVPFDAAIFGINRLKGSKDIILAHEQTGILYYDQYINSAHRAPAWENKKNIAMFRGGATGINYAKCIEENIPLTNNPRFKLHEMTLLQRQGKIQSNVTLDFGIINFFYNKPEIRKAFAGKYQEASFLNYDLQFRNKYLVVVDGHGWPDRISFFMSSGSLVFLATLHEDWTINQIIPGEHYIQVKPDLSDLIEKLEWAYANDAEAKRIAQNGKRFALSSLRRNNVKAYNGLLFMEYQALFE